MHNLMILLSIIIAPPHVALILSLELMLMMYQWKVAVFQ